MRFRAIQRHAGRFPINLMCRMLEVSRGGYYAWLSRPESDRRASNRRLVREIRQLAFASRRDLQQTQRAGDVANHAMRDHRVVDRTDAPLPPPRPSPEPTCPTSNPWRVRFVALACVSILAFVALAQTRDQVGDDRDEHADRECDSAEGHDVE